MDELWAVEVEEKLAGNSTPSDERSPATWCFKEADDCD